MAQKTKSKKIFVTPEELKELKEITEELKKSQEKMEKILDQTEEDLEALIESLDEEELEENLGSAVEPPMHTLEEIMESLGKEYLGPEEDTS